MNHTDLSGIYKASRKIPDLRKYAPKLPEGGNIDDVLRDPRMCDIGLGDAAEPADLENRLKQIAQQEKAAQAQRAEPSCEGPGPVLICLQDIAPRPIDWLWRNRIPIGRITLLVGRPGEGKSFLTCDMAARVSLGDSWPDGAPNRVGSVLLLTAEDDPADTIRPRMDAHGANCRRISILRADRQIDENGERLERLITLADVGCIESALKRMRDCRLVVIDPIGSYLGGGTDAHRDNEVRAVLAPIAALAERYGVAVVIVAHRRKSSGDFADDLALGSRAFTGIARAVWHLARDPENKRRRLLLPGKSNLAPEAGGLAFTIEGKPPLLLWETQPVDMTADDCLAAECQRQRQRQRRGPEPDALTEATDWLKKALANGPRLANELLDEWKNGEGGSKSTLDRARKALKIKAFRPEVPGPWQWRLPEQEPNVVKLVA